LHHGKKSLVYSKLKIRGDQSPHVAIQVLPLFTSLLVLAVWVNW